MANEGQAKAAAAAPEGGAEAAPKKKGPLKMILVVAGVMALEAVAIIAVLGMGGPQVTEAHVEAHPIEDESAEQTQEVVVVEDKFQNLQTGQVWVWDVSVFVQVKGKNAERVQKTLEQRSAEVKEGISQVISRAQMPQLKEPERQTLNRQFTAFLNQVLGQDAEGHPLIERVLIPKCRGFPAPY